MNGTEQPRVSSRSALIAALALLVTFAIVYGTFGPRRQANYLRGWNDFLSFYAGAKLAFTDRLYDPAAISSEQLASGGNTGPALRFIRLPHFAMLLSPLARLPYLHAFAAWQLLNIAGVLGAVWLWPYSRRLFGCTIAAWPPVYWGISLGQDTGLMLLGVSAVVRSIREGSDGGVGTALAWCLIKFHLIWLAPVALVERRKAILIFAAALVVLLGLPAFVNPGWMLQYYETVLKGRSVISHTPQNLFPLLSWFGLPLAAAAVYMLSRRASTEISFGWALVLGLGVSPHAFVYDYTLAVPLIAMAIERKGRGIFGTEQADPAVNTLT